MYQQIDPQPTPRQNPLYRTTANAEPTATGVFAGLSAAGQQTVTRYFAYVERALPTALSLFERDETLRELQSHLLSLIVAFQELGDDEPKAIASAIAQFGKAQTVSGGLRRAERRNTPGISPALVVPLLLFSLALLMPCVMEMYYPPFFRIAGHTGFDTIGLFSWPGLFLLPFAAGAFGASRKEKRAKRDLFVGMGLVVATAVLMSFAFTEPIQTSPKLFSDLRTVVIQASGFWLISAALGIGFAHGANVLNRRKQAT